MAWQPNFCTFYQCFGLPYCVCAKVSCIRPCLGVPHYNKAMEMLPLVKLQLTPAMRCPGVLGRRWCPGVLGRRNLTMSDGTTACGKQVTLSTCDKSGHRARNKKFQCMAVMGQRMVEFRDGCPLDIATYIDVVQCRTMISLSVVTS